MIELVITHDGRYWTAKNEFLNASAASLEELDVEVGRLLHQSGYIEKGQKLKVFMAFDNSQIPRWIRQYAQHYFNRIVEVKV